MKQNTCERGWDFFDEIYCITLVDRPDRRESAEQQFRRVGLANRVEFFIVERDSGNPERGIYVSHLACIRKGLQAGAKYILVFEDDVAFDRFSSVRLDECVGFLKKHARWDILFLGCLVKRSYKTDMPGIRRIRYGSLAHAYVLNRTFAERLASIPWAGLPLDAALREFADGQFVLCPAIAFQNDSPSDNDRHRGREVFRRLLGGLMRIQKNNEFYHCHRTMIVALHIWIPFLVALWLMR